MQTEKGSPEQSWRQWYKREAGTQYSQANLVSRIVRGIRISRLLLPASILVFRLKPSGAYEALTLAVFLSGPFALIALLQATYTATACCPRPGDKTDNSDGSRSWYSITARPVTRVLNVGVGAAVVFGVLMLGSLGWFRLTPMALVDGAMAFALLLFWASRICTIASVWPLKDGTRVVWKLFDLALGVIVLSIQTFFAALCPMGQALHTRMLFSREYGDTVAVVVGARDALDRHGHDAGVRYLKLKHVGQLDFKHHGHKNKDGAGPDDARPENRIGIRQFKLKRIGEASMPISGTGVTKDGQRLPGSAAGSINAAAGTGLGAPQAGHAKGSGSGSGSSVGDPSAAVDGELHNNPGNALDATSAVGGLGGTGLAAIAMMNMGGATTATAPVINMGGATTAAAPVINMGGATTAAGPIDAAGPSTASTIMTTSTTASSRVRKTVREILAEGQAVGRKAEATAAAGAGDDKGKGSGASGHKKGGSSSGSGSDDSSSKKKKKTKSGKKHGAVAKRWPPAAKGAGGSGSSSDGDDGDHDGGVSDLRARFEKHKGGGKK